MKWTIRIKRTSTSCIYDSKLTCYNVVFILNLVAKSHACNARVPYSSIFFEGIPYSSLNDDCVCVVRVEVQIVFFGYTLSLFFRNFKPRLVMPKFQLASLSIMLRNSCLFNPRLVSLKYLRYIFVSSCSETCPHLNPRLAIPNYNVRGNSHLMWNPDTRNASGTPEAKEAPQIGGGVGERSRNSKFSTQHQDQSMEILATREEGECIYIPL